jgi:hypothetical protein
MGIGKIWLVSDCRPHDSRSIAMFYTAGSVQLTFNASNYISLWDMETFPDVLVRDYV